MAYLETVKAYYPKVDAGDVEGVIGMFADDGEYQRVDAAYNGKQAIADFYRGDRKIQGTHSLKNVVAEANTVIANAVFEGVGADGSPKKIGFADVWQFDTDGLVNSRKTYLAVGSDYVKD
jgi:ketosteroid isomerase-like protein